MRRLHFQLISCLTLLAWIIPTTALEKVDHPDFSYLTGNVAELLSSAQAAFRDAQAENRISGDDYGRLAQIYQAHEQDLPATQAYRNAMELAPNDARWPYFLGVIAVGAGDFAQGAAYFRDSIADNPNYGPAHIRLSRALYALGDVAAAREQMTTLLERYPGVAAVHADNGKLLLAAGEPALAIPFLERALELQPQANQLHYSLGQAYRATGDIEKAREHLALRGESEPVFDDPLYVKMRGMSGSFAYFMSLGLSAARAGNAEIALDFMTKAVEANPRSAEARINLARMLELNGRMNEAMAEIDRFLEEQPGNALALFNRGVMLELTGDELGAQSYYERSLSNDPDLFDARLLLANNLMRAGEYSAAADQYARAYDSRPNRSELMLNRALAWFAAGDCQSAISSALDLVTAVPENFEALITYSRIVATCPEASEADRRNGLNAARNMYLIDPHLPVVTTLAMAEAAVGNFDSAVDFQTQALFMATREGLTTQIETLKVNLDAFQAGNRASVPWRSDHPILNPRKLTPEDRR